jgi:sugar phosphate isomerase/epimerase
MKYGFMVSREPIEAYFDYAKDHAIQHLEIDLKKTHSLPGTFTPGRISTIRKFCTDNNISLSLHPPYNKNLCSRIPMVRAAHVSYLKYCIKLADGLNARHLTLHLGNYYRFAVWSNPRDHALLRLYRVLRKLLPYCEKNNVNLALENMVPIPPEAGYSFLGDNVDDFLKIFSQIKSPYLGFCLDIGHANIAEGPLKYIQYLGHKILSVHFHDNRGLYDEHMDVGTGTVPWGSLLTSLHLEKFKGPYVSECFNSAPHEAISALKKQIT